MSLNLESLLPVLVEHYPRAVKIEMRHHPERDSMLFSFRIEKLRGGK